MTHLVDAQQLVATFKSHDAFMPGLVFGLLDYYFDVGPFKFDPTKISERLAVSKFDRMPPEVLAQLESELQIYFLPSADGWVPRPGILAVD